MWMSKAARRVRTAARNVEMLEARCLLSATVSSQVPSQAIFTAQGPTTLNLSTYFSDPEVTGTVVLMQTPEGNIPLSLTDSQTPLTVANFVKYINTGEYVDTIVHRSVPGFVIQGGGYTPNGNHITQFQTVQGEAGISNTVGTIAMALSNGPNSGTSEWFINLGDNSSALDGTADGGPFTVFGRVIDGGMNVVNSIANLPIVNDSVQSSAWSALPVTTTYTGPSTTTGPLPSSDLVTNNTVIASGALRYAVTSADTSIATASISNGMLTLTPAAGITTGSTSVTVTATDVGGESVSSTFAVDINGFAQAVTLGTGGVKAVTYKDSSGAVSTVTYKGVGSAVVNFFSTAALNLTSAKSGATITGAGAVISSIDTTGSNGGSSLTIASKSGAGIGVGNINVESIKSITAKGTTLSGNVVSSGAIGALTIAGAQGGSVSAASVGSISCSGNFADGLILSGGLGKFKGSTITAGTWGITGAAGSVQAGSTSGWTGVFGSVKSIAIKGNIASSALQLTGSGTVLGKLTAGAVSGSVIRAAGSIGTITVASLAATEIYASVGNLVGNQVLPNAPVDFISDQSIGSVSVKGGTFSNSAIAAATIGKLSLGTIQTSNGGIPTGIGAKTIRLITGTANKKFSLKNLSSGTNITSELTAAGVTPGDFTIMLF